MRKRILALLSAAAICLSLHPMAWAESAQESEGPVEQLTSEKMEGILLSDFSYDSARAVIGGCDWEGISFREVGRKFWLPAGVERIELDERDIAEGYQAVFLAGNFYLAIVHADYGGIDLDAYLALIKQNHVSNVRVEEVNGVQTVIYDELQDDTLCRVAAMEDSDGTILEFVYCTSDESLDLVMDVCIASIRVTE